MKNCLHTLPPRELRMCIHILRGYIFLYSPKLKCLWVLLCLKALDLTVYTNSYMYHKKREYSSIIWVIVLQTRVVPGLATSLKHFYYFASV